MNSLEQEMKNLKEDREQQNEQTKKICIGDQTKNDLKSIDQDKSEQQNQIQLQQIQVQEESQINQNCQVPNGYDDQNREEIEILDILLDDIKQELLNDEETIINEISPVFEKLNQHNQDYFKYLIHHQFPDKSFIKNPRFKIQQEQEEVNDDVTLFQKLKTQKNWKALLIQLSNEQFCQFNNFPKTWSSKENLKVLQNHEFILEKILNLNELCSMQNGYHYIEVTELLIVLFDYVLKQEQDGNTICQIIGSTLRVQLYQFQQFKSALRDKNQYFYEKMVQELQQYQLKQISEINQSQYSQEFQLVIKICISNWNVKSFESFLNDNYQLNLRELSLEQIQFKIQDIVVQNKMIEEIYFSLVFFYYTQYCCSLFNFLKEKCLLDEQLTKVKGQRDRLLNQVKRNTKKMIDSKDEILIFLINQIFYFSDEKLDIIGFDLNFQQFQQLSTESEKQLQPIFNKDFQYIFQNRNLFDQYIQFIPQIKIGKLFTNNQKMELVILLFNYLKRNYLNFEELLNFLLQQQETSFGNNFKYLQNSYESTMKKQVTIYALIFMNELNSFLNSKIQFYIKIFKIESSFNKAILIQYLLQITQKKKINISQEQKIYLSQEILDVLQNQNSKDWLIIHQALGVTIIQDVFEIFFDIYLKVQQLTMTQKKIIYKILCELKHLIGKESVSSIWFFQLILDLCEDEFNFLVIQMQNETTQLEENVFKGLIRIIYNLLKKMNQQDQELMIFYLMGYFKNENFDFIGMKQLVKSNIKLENMQYYQLINYYKKFSLQDKLFQIAKQFFQEDLNSYQLLFEQKNYFNFYQIHPLYLKNLEIQQIYPQQSLISLEDFNISLSELNDQQKQIIIDEWSKHMNLGTYFKKLIPFYFNVIKRKEQSKNLLSYLSKNEKLKKLKLNMKAMFQIFYNNSNDELKSMLLKLWCLVNPIPLLFTNPKIGEIKSLQSVFQLNEKVFFVFPDCYPIINLSLSKKQNSFGKTNLINRVFYMADIFEVSDSCELNQNTIDVMFDYCFSGSRNLAIADVHGSIPTDVLIKILPLFQIWIIQMDSEEELQENYNEIQKIKQQLKLINECCFVVRNCKNKQKESELEKKIERENVSIHKIIDFTQKGLDKQAINTEIEEFSCFIFQKVQKLKKCQLKNSEDFLNLLTTYYNQDNPQIIQINQGNKLLKQLDQVLESFTKDCEGFYSKNAFPIRAMMWKIKKLKQDLQKLDHLKKDEQQRHVDSKKSEIYKLEQDIPFAKPTEILNLFQEIFQQDDFYSLYLKFTEKIRKFNEIHTYKLQEKNQQINEQLQKKKQEKKRRQQSNIQTGQSELKQSNSDSQTKELKHELEENLKAIELRNIGIELFWRELISIKQKGQSNELKINPSKFVAKMVKKGEPFEFLDGDLLQIDSKFLLDFIKQFSDSDEKVLVLSILGPQSSGKSTILNKIFGCHFWTSVGRCTKGIYLQLLKITQKNHFDNQFDYVLILDSEGLQNPNQADPEFDKKIALFILAISDIILINVKGDIHSQFKNLVEMCIFTLGQMKNSISSVKQLSWCFNQNNDCKNFAPFLEQIQSIVNTLNLQINKTEEEGDNSSFDYNEVLDLKKENIKILGFASTEQTWRINANTGIYEEWRQQIINETFSEEAYIFGVQMIKQYLSKIIIDQNFQLPSLTQFISNIENTWHSICRLPDLLEFTELLQYKQDQSMKARYEQIQQNEPLNYQMQIPKKVQDSVLKERKKNLEFFKRIEQDEKNCIKYEIEKIKNNVEQELQKYKQENSIQNKICKKYIKILDQSLQTYEYNCHLVLFDEIKKHEREYQQKKGFTQIEDLVSKISQNAQELQQLKGKRELQEKKFEEIWSNIVKEAISQQDKVFEDYSKAQYQAIKSSFVEYQFNSQNQEQFQEFFFQISKNRPTNLEKSDIMKMYMIEINQQQQRQFITIRNSNVKYNDIFYQPIEERLKQSSQNSIINLNNFFFYQGIIYQIQSDIFFDYLHGDAYYEDFCKFMKRVKNQNQQKQYRDRYINDQFSIFFSLLEYLQINYQQENYDDLKQHVIKGDSWFKLGLDTKSYFQEFQKTLAFTEQTSQIVLITEFTRNMKNTYPSLGLVEYLVQGPNILEIDQQYQKLNGQIKFLLSLKIFPRSNTHELFYYLLDQKQYYHYAHKFQNDFPYVFESIVSYFYTWNTIYFEIYDIIKQKMSSVKQKDGQANQAANQLDSDSENEEILASDNYLIKQIMSIIEQKIIEYNKQLANFGVIFTMIGERCIYYFSIFIIWRFSCYSKWKQLQENNQKLIKMRDEQLQKFIAEIEQNKTQQSILNAQVLIKNIKTVFFEKFYQDQLPQVSQSIESMNMSSRKLVQILDDRLLLNYESAKQNNIQDQEILSYILDQKSYIEQYAEKQIKIKENKIKLEYQEKLRIELRTFLKQIFNNISVIEAYTRQQSYVLKSEEYFEVNDDEIKNCDYDNQLFLLISKCIQGEKLNNENLLKINASYVEMFKQPYKEIKIPIFIKTQNESEKKIPQLKPFIEELYKLVQQQIQDSDTEPLISNNLKMQEYLNKQKLNMIGCLFTCPMCKRKCDQPNDNNHKHTCQNGHQYRGMNGVLINNKWPSLFTCEEINENAIITTLETSTKKRWKEIKNAYFEWNFRGVTDEESEKLNKKMKDIWNSGIGELICQELSKKLNTKIQFESKSEFNHDKQNIQPIHYILMLDDSGSMKGQRWENAKNGALECMKDISKNGEAKVSVIIFNTNARVVIDCEEVNIENQKDLITFKGGDTSFNQAFLKAFDQILKHNYKKFDRNIILFYTDGEDRYPKEAVEKFCLFEKDIKQSIKLVSCAESDQQSSASLNMITNTLMKAGIQADLKSNIQVENLQKVWTEVVTQSYHNLRC